jgi:hypothetical protein
LREDTFAVTFGTCSEATLFWDLSVFGVVDGIGLALKGLKGSSPSTFVLGLDGIDVLGGAADNDSVTVGMLARKSFSSSMICSFRSKE